MRHDPEHWGRRDPRGPRGCSGSSGRAERNPVAACGGRISQPAGRRRHSGAQRSPLPIVPRTRTAFPSVAGRRSSEPPARPSPPPTARVAGEAWVASQRSKVGRSGSPGESLGCSIPPACARSAGAVSRRGAGGLCYLGSVLTLTTIPPSASAAWRIPEFVPRRTAEQARGKLRSVQPVW